MHRAIAARLNRALKNKTREAFGLSRVFVWFWYLVGRRQPNSPVSGLCEKRPAIPYLRDTTKNTTGKDVLPYFSNMFPGVPACSGTV
ncbi:hypothetical protein [Paraburkholderia sacchari]|uniref:hypothetical protein n=1 Tax=Paraburkholderia sacchari TaxID=159450 RepID=UPI0039A56197